MESREIYIGIDPGVTGAVSFLIPAKADALTIHTMPDDPMDVEDLISLCVAAQVVTNALFITLENVKSSPQMGVVSAFTFGKNYGMLYAIAQRIRADGVQLFENPTPQKWQTALNCLTGGDKKISKARAHELFPDAKGITLQTADSVLLAYYGYLKYGKRKG